MSITVRIIAVTLVFALGACSSNQGALFSPSSVPASNIRLNQSSFSGAMATSHVFVLRLPSSDIEAVQQKHLNECAKVKCKVLGANLERSIEGRATARTSLRLPPDAYPAFAAMLVAPPATLASHSETNDDRSQPTLDIERRLQSKYALRDRLTAMLQDAAAKSLSDLVAAEKELAQVQREIEEWETQRDQLRASLETIRVEITYQGLAAQVAGVDISAVTRAVDAIGPTLATSTATLIWFLALSAPWLPLVALLLWGAGRYFRRRPRPEPLPQS